MNKNNDCRFFVSGMRDGRGGAGSAILSFLLLFSVFLTFTSLRSYDECEGDEGGAISEVVSYLQNGIKNNDAIATFLGIDDEQRKDSAWESYE